MFIRWSSVTIRHPCGRLVGDPILFTRHLSEPRQVQPRAWLFARVVLQFATPVTDWLAISFFSLVICLNLVKFSLVAVMKNLVSVMIRLGVALSVGSLVIFECSLIAFQQ